MKFPNAYSGVKKIWLAEILMLLAAVLGIIMVIVVAGNTQVVDGEVVAVAESVGTPAAILTIGTALLALVAFILNLVGIISARKDDDAFKIALFVTLVGIIASVIASIWSTNAVLTKWTDVVNTLCNLFASYFVLTGIASLANRYPDPETRDFALKSRTWLEGSFCLTAVLKFINNIFNIQNETIVIIMGVAALLVEIISYVLYLRALSKGKDMLAR